MNRYYCPDCKETHVKSGYEKEVLLETAFYAIDGIVYSVGYCNEAKDNSNKFTEKVNCMES